MSKQPNRLLQLTTLFRQLPPARALGVVIQELVRSAVNPSSIITYSQTGEDRLIEYLLWQVLRETGPGFYVEVGSNDPVSNSNTRRLYERGWRGLAIDANPALLRKFSQARPRDLACAAAVSNASGPATFVIRNNTTLSSLADDNDTRLSDDGRYLTVQTTTLAELFARYQVPHRFSLLCVDVEGADLAVITSFDIDRFRPRLIVVEMHGFDISRPQADPLYSHLTRHGYRLHGYAAMNGYFIDGDVPTANEQ